MTGDADHSDTAGSVKVTIQQATNEWTDEPSISGWTYGDEANAPSAEAKFGEVKYTYATEKDGTYTDTAPTAAGTYYVRATVDETTNYTGLSETVKFTITEADSAYTTKPTANTLTYNGEAQKLVSEGSTEDGTIYYKLGEDGEYTTNVPTATGTGTYTVYYYISGDGNHSDSEPESVAVTIGKAALTVTADAQSKIYGEDDPELTYTVTGLADGDSLTGALSREAGEDVGTYAIGQGTLTAGDNYELTFTGAALTIEAKSLNSDGITVTIEPGETEATGGAITPSVVVRDGDKVLTEDVDYELSGETSGADVGIYTIVVTGIGNYSDELIVEWTISEGEDESGDDSGDSSVDSSTGGSSKKSASKSSTPKTGDSSHPWLWGTLLAASGSSLVFLAVRKKREDEE